MNTGKVQTNDHGCNVLVETKNSNNRHLSHLDKDVEVVKTLSDDEIIHLWKNRECNDELTLAKDWIMKQKNYACSNIKDDTLGITWESIVKYEIKS